MKITKIESRIIGYDVAEAWLPEGPPDGLHSTWYSYSLDAFHTDEGIVGYTMQNTNVPDGDKMADVLHSVYVPELLGEDPTRIEYLWDKLRRVNRHAYNLSDGVAGSIDVALWDIVGKVANQPIARILGLAREKIPAYRTASSVRPVPETVFNEAKRVKESGFHGFKIQFWDGLEQDIPRFQAAREAVGPDFPLMQDAAGQYSFTQALAAGKELGRLNYYWFEEPIPDRNTLQLKRLTHDLDVPILAGETLRVHELAEQMAAGVFDIARGDVHLKEGITGMRKAIGMADLLGFDLEVHGIGQPLLECANLHISASMLNGRWCETFHPVYGKGLKGNPLAPDKDGYKQVPMGPGLGVELDWDFLDNNTRRTIVSPAP